MSVFCGSLLGLLFVVAVGCVELLLVWDIVLSFVLLLFRRAWIDVILLLSLCDCCVVMLLS